MFNCSGTNRVIISTWTRYFGCRGVVFNLKALRPSHGIHGILCEKDKGKASLFKIIIYFPTFLIVCWNCTCQHYPACRVMNKAMLGLTALFLCIKWGGSDLIQIYLPFEKGTSATSYLLNCITSHGNNGLEVNIGQFESMWPAQNVNAKTGDKLRCFTHL